MATKERDRATSNYKLARTAVHDIYVGMMVTDDRSKVTLMQDPAVRPVRDFLLGRILNYQRGFIKKNPADMTVRLELADIQKSGNRLVNTLTGAGAKLLQFFAPTIQKVINRFNFIIEKWKFQSDV